MSKEELDNISNNIEDNSNETEVTKRLCVHDLKRKLKEKQKKENIGKATILFTLILLIGFLLLFIY
jgi:hypothetical protein